METFELIRRLVLVDGLSQREVARKLNCSRKSIRKALGHSEPVPYTCVQPRSRPVTDAVMPIVKAWLEEDKSKPRKQQHTKTRIFERLRDEYGFEGSKRAVQLLVARLQDKPAKVFCPIEHPPGDEVQIDWGQATVVLAGQETKVMNFCARCAYSKATFVRAYLRDDMISFLDAHVWLFNQLGGVPRKLAYDNLKTAVAHIRHGGGRTLTARFLAMRSHYLFESRFCNVASGNEKGHVENSVKRSERTYLTPVPQVPSLEALNEHLSASTARDLARVDSATGLTYGQLFEQERQLFRPLPTSPFMACTTQAVRVDKRATVPHQQSRYSVPVEHATKHVVLRAFVERIEVLLEDRIVARHERVEPGLWSLQVEHYVSLLETKPGLLDSGKPFVKQAWTASQQLFRSELEFRYQGEGTRKFIDILLLAKKHDWRDVCRAIDVCCRNHAFNEQAVLMELEGGKLPYRQTQLNLADHPQLQQCQSGMRDLACYDSLAAEILAHPAGHLDDDRVSESVSNHLARSAHDDRSQDAQVQPFQQFQLNSVVPSAGVAPEVFEATCHAG